MTVHPYATSAYAEASSEGADSFYCESLGTRLVVRRIEGTDQYDAQGLYPFSCELRQTSRTDLAEELGARGLVALVFVTDCLDPDLGWTDCLDLARPYKSHHVIDQSNGPTSPTRHHQQEIRRALKRCEVRQIDLGSYLCEWRSLYDNLVQRRGLSERHLFSDRYFEALSNIPGFVSFAAFLGNCMVSCHIWAQSGPHVHSHLAASNDAGYRIGAAYAVNDRAIEHFSNANVIDLGGVPDSNGGDGLDYFKRGFSNATRWNRICGLIVNPIKYDELRSTLAAKVTSKNFFPVYR